MAVSTFFDTAASYGNGASETNLGRALGGNTEGLVVSTKVGLSEEDLSLVFAGNMERVFAEVTGPGTQASDAVLVEDLDTRCAGQQFARPVGSDLVPRLDVKGLRVPVEHRHAHGGRERTLGYRQRRDDRPAARAVDESPADARPGL